MALLQSTTISGSNANTGSLSITGSTMVFPVIESSLTGSFSGSGKMWVNADGQTLQYSVQTSLGTIQSPASFMGAWSAGGNLIVPQQNGAGNGLLNAGWVAAGCGPGGQTTCMQEYDSTTWSTGGALSIARYAGAGAGTQNAAFVAGGTGTYIVNTEEYDGSSWSNMGNMIQGRNSQGAAGTSYAAISFAGYQTSPSTAYSKTTNYYNGCSWESGPDMNICRYRTAGGGSSNATIAYNGQNPDGKLTCVETFNGDAWSNAQGTNNVRRSMPDNHTEDIYDVVAMGGDSPVILLTEEWNGITWTNSCNMLIGINNGQGGGSASGGFATGGASPYPLTTEHYEKTNISPYTTCVWTSGGGMITPRSQGGGGGTQNAALVAAGGTPTRVSCTEEYDGTSWAEGGALSITRSALAGGGTQNAGWVAGGEPAGGTATEEYNGTSWASGGTLSIGGYGKRGGGPQTAAQVISGTPNPRVTNQTYDGTTWTSATSMPAARSSAALTGTCAASIVDGGSPYTTTAILWNGSSWSETGTKTTCTSGNQMGGTQNNALSFGGYNPANPTSVVSTEHYDGSAWSVQGNLSVAAKYGQGAATSPAGPTDSFYAGGYNTAIIGNMQLFGSVCSSTLCSNLPVWSGVAPMLAHTSYMATFGTQNAAVVTTGKDASASTTFGTEEYNGTSWSPGGTNVNQTGQGTGRFAAGTLNAGLLMGGWPTQTWTEEYDGTSWTAANAMSICRNSGGGNGTQTAALVAGGIMTYPNKTSATEEYDGTNWSNGGSLSIARYLNLSTGTQNDAVTTGGQPGSTSTEEYNGSTWATGGNLPGGKGDVTGAMMGVGAYDATFAGGMTPTRLSDNFQYDGASWSVRPPYPLAIAQVGRAGTSTAGIVAGGRTNTGVSSRGVSTYNDTIDTCIPIFTWSAGGSLSIAVYDHMGTGTQNAALSVGGFTPAGITSATNEYNGSTWASANSAPANVSAAAAAGILSAGLVFGGNPGGTSTIEYDGTNWSAGGALIQGRGYLFGGAGTQNAAKAFGGLVGPTFYASTENYDGSSWSATTCMSVARSALGATQKGTQNSVLAFGGYTGPGCISSTCVEGWNGTAWSTHSDIISGMGFGNGRGSSDIDAMRVAGYTHPSAAAYITNCVSQYDGVAWSSCSSVLIPMHYNSGAGSSASSLTFGARTPITGLTYEGTSTTERQGAGTQSWIGKVDFVTE